jgi:hypothetical protein
MFRAVGRRPFSQTRATFLNTDKSISFPIRRSIGYRTRCPLPRSPQLGNKEANNSSFLSELAARNIFGSRGRNFQKSPTSVTASYFGSALCIPQRRTFSSTRGAMTATKIDGTAIAKAIRERIQKEIQDTQTVNPRYKPSLKIIQGCYTCLSEFKQY